MQNRQFLVEVPGNIEISPEILFRHLAEKFASMSNNKKVDTSSNYLIRPQESHRSLSNIVFTTDSRQMTSQSIDSSLSNNVRLLL